MAASGLLAKIEQRAALISVIGLGHVGLPLAAGFAEAGFPVLGIDTDRAKVEAIDRGESYVSDVSSETLRRLADRAAVGSDGGRPGGRLSAVADYERLEESDVIIVCVPTPLGKTKDPDLSFIVSTAEEIARRMRRGALVVLESTTYPGTTEELILPNLQDLDGRRYEAGTDFFLAYSPERLDPGRKDWTLGNTPKVIGGVTPACVEVGARLYECVVDRVVPVDSPKVAEMVKLLENTFRATNIALVNEFAIMCGRLGIDIWHVIEAAKTKPFGFMPFHPGPGLGGHCIPIDPQYLAWKLKTVNYNARFIQLAAEINFGMPSYVAGKIAHALNEESKPMRGSRILVLGIAYKEDVADLRESPALDLIRLLRGQGADVAYNDPYIPLLRHDDIAMDGVSLTEEELRRSDCVVIVTPHQGYDWRWVVDNSSLVVDTRNATGGLAGPVGRVVKL
ncbi:MAG: nucleotide sugar dehydrogenase [Dehalococcoidia bacterium]|nr:nucleotide sugar dehydrogenase [Dehalococcoidia bacterium]